MPVNNYLRNCSYNLNKLDNYIYLYKFNETTLDYITDENETNATASEIKGQAYRIYCENVAYQSTSTVNSRFSFENTLTITLTEGKDETYYSIIQQLITNNWMIVFKNVGGEYFVVNAEYPVMVSYSYVFNDEKSPNNLTITFKALQNVPTVNLKGSVTFSDTLRHIPCEYNISRIKSLKMIDRVKSEIDIDDYSLVEKGEGSLKTIEFNPSSFIFTDSYDGKEFSQTISFQIPFDAYIYYFHYNLLEYLNNRYYALIETTNGNYIISGFKDGLFPSYTINQDNIITIELKLATSNYSIIAANDIGLLTVPYKEYIKLFGECIDNIFTYTLIQENNTDNYYVLEGYESQYSDYNVVDTYNKFDTEYGFKLIDWEYDCNAKCAINGLPSSIIFNKPNETRIFQVTSECDFTFDYDNNLVDVSYSTYTLSITNKVEGETQYNINVISENGTIYKILCLVTNNINADQVLNITAEKQNVNVIPINGMTNITSVETNLKYQWNQYGNGYVFSIPMNTSTSNTINYNIVINYNNNTTETILIIQDKLYEKLVDNGMEECFGDDLHKSLSRYIGYTEDSVNIPSGSTKGELIESKSLSCISYDKKEIIDTICYKKVTYNIVRYSLNGTTIKEQAELEGNKCDGDGYDKWVINSGKTICENNRPYYIEEKYISGDNVHFYLLYPIVERTSETEAPDSNICNVVGDVSQTLYKWVYTNDTYCLDSNDEDGVDYNCEKTSGVTYIEGDESTYMCYKYNKYKLIAKLISTHCDGDYRVYDYEQGELIEENCEACGYIEKEVCEPNLSKTLTGVTVYYNGKDVEYNEFAVPIVSGTIISTLTYENCSTEVKQETKEITDYTISYSPSGENTTNDNRDVIATVKYNDEVIGQFMYIQKLNPNGNNNENGGGDDNNPTTPSGSTSGDTSDSGSTSDTLSFEFSGSSTTYKLNGTTYTATSSPYTTSLEDLGITTLTSCSGTFSGSSITNLISFPDTSNVTEMQGMFNYCVNLTSLDLSSFDTSNVENFTSMFYVCKNLQTLDVSSWDVSHITNSNLVRFMLTDCAKLTKLKIKQGTRNWWCARLNSVPLSCDIIEEV